LFDSEAVSPYFEVGSHKWGDDMVTRKALLGVVFLFAAQSSLSAQQYIKDEPPDVSRWTVTKTSNYSTGCGIFFKEYMIRKDLVDPETHRTGVLLLSGSLLKESKPVLIGWEDESGETRVALRRQAEIGGWITGYYTFETKLIWKKSVVLNRCALLRGIEISLFGFMYGEKYFVYKRMFPPRYAP